MVWAKGLLPTGSMGDATLHRKTGVDLALWTMPNQLSFEPQGEPWVILFVSVEVVSTDRTRQTHLQDEKEHSARIRSLFPPEKTGLSKLLK